MARRDKAAYFLVNISGLSLAVQRELIEDSMLGGGDYGVRVVEEIHNGPARVPVYGVYYGPDEAKWASARAEFGIVSSAPTADDEDAIAEQARVQADQEAERVRLAEEEEQRAITKEDPKDPAATQNKNKR